MVQIPDGRPEVVRKELLFDKPLLRHYLEQYDTAIDIKRNVDTTAKVYEIRTAVQYWFGGDPSHRTSDRVWETCEAIDEGEWMLVGDEFKYADEVSA